MFLVLYIVYLWRKRVESKVIIHVNLEILCADTFVVELVVVVDDVVVV